MKLAAFVLNLVFTCLSGLISVINIISNVVSYITMKNIAIQQGIYIGSIGTYITLPIICLIFSVTLGILFTIFSYQIYKGTRKNTLAIAICDLLFCGLVSGILLLIDYAENNPEKKNKETSKKETNEVINDNNEIKE